MTGPSEQTPTPAVERPFALDRVRSDQTCVRCGLPVAEYASFFNKTGLFHDVDGVPLIRGCRSASFDPERGFDTRIPPGWQATVNPNVTARLPADGQPVWGFGP